MRVGIIGTGYVGLVAGAGFAEHGNNVVCADVAAGRIEALKSGQVPFYEPGLPELVAKNAEAKRLKFTTDIAEASLADVVFLAVGTPSLPGGSADLSQVLEAARAVGASLRDGTIVATKSTVPVGTADKVREAIASVTGRSFVVASNPEFLREGCAVKDFMEPARVVVGIDAVPDEPTRDRAIVCMRWLYRFVDSARFIDMDARSAELSKYAANAYLATRLSFINDIANLCDATGADVEAVRRSMGMDPRIGSAFLAPGIGYGGSCFPKDTRALIKTAKAHNMCLDVVEGAVLVNQRQKLLPVRLLEARLGSLCGKRIAVWGLAFKPETDDIREAPALSIIERLLNLGATVRACDLIALDNAQRALSPSIHLDLTSQPYEAAQGADALLLCTEWQCFRDADWSRVREAMNGRLVIDGRNALSPQKIRDAGLEYVGIGRH